MAHIVLRQVSSHLLLNERGVASYGYGPCTYGQYNYGPCSYGQYSYGPCSYGPYSYSQYIVMAQSRAQHTLPYTYGPYGYGPYGYGPCSYGPYSCGPYSYGLGWSAARTVSLLARKYRNENGTPVLFALLCSRNLRPIACGLRPVAQSLWPVACGP